MDILEGLFATIGLMLDVIGFVIDVLTSIEWATRKRPNDGQER